MKTLLHQSEPKIAQNLKYAPIILVHPHLETETHFSKNQPENHTTFETFLVSQIEGPSAKIPEFDQIPQIQAYSSFDSQIQNDQDFLENSSITSKKRANRSDTLKDIDENNVDHGRGGNCVGSNICKTLVRIAFSHLHGGRLENFKQLLRKYQIKSQKENSVILMLLLHVFGKQKALSLELYDHIVGKFHHSLKESQHNCERKMKEEQVRKNFHGKNKKMYRLFSEMNREIYERSLSNLKEDQTWDIKKLEQIVSNSYDRKQRDVEKAMNKVKSIVLRHPELRSWFEFDQIDVVDVFFEAIDFAYRRNLPKRCKQIKENARKIIQKINNQRTTETEEEKYLVCYMSLRLINEKVKEIWQEFVSSLFMKQEYSQRQEERLRLKEMLESEIPRRFEQELSFSLQKVSKIQEQVYDNQMNEKQQIKEQHVYDEKRVEEENKCKIEEDTYERESQKVALKVEKKQWGNIFLGIKKDIEF